KELLLSRNPNPINYHSQPSTSVQTDRAVHPRDNCIALRHPERSARTEVILDVDDEQRGPLPHGPDRPNVTVAKSLRPPGSSGSLRGSHPGKPCPAASRRTTAPQSLRGLVAVPSIVRGR